MMVAMKRVMLIAVLVAWAGCSKGPSEDQCKQLLEHLVDLEFKKAGAAASGDALKADLAKQKAAVIETKSGDFIAACKDKTAKSRVECALAATDLEAVGKCDEQ